MNRPFLNRSFPSSFGIGYRSVERRFYFLKERGHLDIRQLSARVFPPLPIDLLIGPLDHFVDGLADYVQPRDDLVGERMIVLALCSFMIECELTALSAVE